jgi:hypothetical protein
MRSYYIAMVCALFSATAVLAQNDLKGPRLEGLINLPTDVRAILQAEYSRRRECVILAAGQRDGPREVTAIHPETASAEVRSEGRLWTVRMPAVTNLPVNGLEFNAVPMSFVMRLYGQLLGRTVLSSPNLPQQCAPISLRVNSKAEAAQGLEKALRDQSVLTVLDGARFVLVGPVSEADSLKPGSPPSSGASTNAAARSSDSEVIPPGMIDFRGVDLRSVAELYCAYAGQRLEANGAPPHGSPVFIFVETALTHAEATYALEKLIRLHGFKGVPATTTNSVRFVPVKE